MPSENTFFPESNSRNASVNAKIIIKSPKEPKPKFVKSTKEVSRGVSILNHNKNLTSPSYSINPKPEVIINSKATCFFKTSPRSCPKGKALCECSP